MNAIERTDDKARMEEIGRELFSLYANKYNEAMVAKINSSIDKFMPFDSKKDKESRFYRTVYNYWVYGNDTDEDFYLGFDHLNDKEKGEYMTMRKKLIYIYHLNNKAHQYIFDDKYETFRLLSNYYLRDVIRISSPEDYGLFRDFISKHPSFVVKPCGLSFAIGVYRVDIDQNTDVDKVFETMLRKGKEYKKDYWGESTSVVVEELIDQCEELAALHRESVNGVRVTTVRVNNDVHIYYQWIKVGVGGDFIASASQGGLDIGIDAETGILNTNGFNEKGEEFECHPNTGIKFIGYQIPKWDALIKMAKEIAASLPKDINYIGWDVVLTDKGWCVMEGNFRGDFMWQMFYKKGMLKEFEDLIGWKHDKEFWWQS